MRDILDRLLVLNTRDIIGRFLWLLVGIVFCRVHGWKGLLLCLFVMAAREVWQWKHYHLQCFEWEDVLRYTIILLVGYVVAMMI